MVEPVEDIRVLHVDDDPEFSEMVSHFLRAEDEKFSVETATSTADGLETLATGAVDCVVSDYRLPSETGIDFLETVRETHPDLPFILFTGKGSEEVASEAISAGVSDYLQKQSGTDQYAVLANRIANLVAQHRAVAETEEYAKRDVESEAYRQRLLDVISDSELTDEQKVERLLKLGCERFGVENGHLVLIDESRDRHEVIAAYGSDIVTEGVSDLSQTYCRRTVESNGILELHNAKEQGWEEDPALQRYGLQCYLSGKLTSQDDLLGTLCFADTESREPFSHHEKAFLDLLLRWFSQVAERFRNRRENEREREFVERFYDVVSDDDSSVEEKARDLLGVGREYLDLPHGFLIRSEPLDESESADYQTIAASRAGDRTFEEREAALWETYGRRTLTEGGFLAVHDADTAESANSEMADTDGVRQYDSPNLECYIGAEVSVDGESYGVFCFTSVTPRDDPFTETEQTYVRFMSRWIGHELERRSAQKEAEQKSERLGGLED